MKKVSMNKETLEAVASMGTSFVIGRVGGCIIKKLKNETAKKVAFVATIAAASLAPFAINICDKVDESLRDFIIRHDMVDIKTPEIEKV